MLQRNEQDKELYKLERNTTTKPKDLHRVRGGKIYPQGSFSQTINIIMIFYEADPRFILYAQIKRRMPLLMNDKMYCFFQLHLLWHRCLENKFLHTDAIIVNIPLSDPSSSFFQLSLVCQYLREAFLFIF